MVSPSDSFPLQDIFGSLLSFFGYKTNSGEQFEFIGGHALKYFPFMYNIYWNQGPAGSGAWIPDWNFIFVGVKC